MKGFIARFAPAEWPTMNAIPLERRRQFLDGSAKVTGREVPPEEPIWAEPTLADHPKMIVNGRAPVPAEAPLPIKMRG